MIERRHLLVPGAVALALLAAAPAPALAKPQPQAKGGTGAPQPRNVGEGEEPVLITAEEMVQDRDLGIVTARGNVEISHQGRILLADTVNYNTKQDVVTASGNVSLLEIDGKVMFADYFELTGDMKDGYAKQVRMLMVDRSRVAAASAQRKGGTETTFNKAVYSPCRPCKEDPSRPPLWQIKTVRMVHDETAKQIEYRDAWLEMGGVPVAYTPYLSHPDPTVKRRSGLLAPTLGGSKSLGATVRTPYYAVLSPHADLTISPMFATSDHPALGLEYRQRLKRGETKTDASFTHDKNGRDRGHVFSDTRYDIDDTWRSRLEVQRTTDGTYLRRYGYHRAAPWLTSRGLVEGFGHRSYASAQAYSYQGLRRDWDHDATPYLVPVADYNYVGEPMSNGSYFSMDSNLLAVQRTTGADARRLSVTSGWTLPYTAPAGDIYSLSATMRTDGYHVNDVVRGDGKTYEGAAGRAVPEVSLLWRYPFARNGETSQQVIEPVVLAAASPNGGNPDEIPNLDSRFIEFDDTNLFKANRFTGIDRIETGPRLNYGLRVSHQYYDGGRVAAVFGQSYRTHVDQAFGHDTGFDEKLSDYVGRLDVSPSANVNLMYRFRLAKEDFGPERQEVGATVGPRALSVGVNYILLKQAQTESTEFGDREEVALQASTALTRYWSLAAFTRHNLESNGGPVAVGGSAVYEDECFVFRLAAQHDYTSDRDYEGGLSFVARIVFKTLGQVQTGGAL